MKVLNKILFLLMAISSVGYAAGYVPGNVIVYNNGLSITGSYNVRYNPAVSTGRLGVSINPGVSVAITGTDSATGQNFSCFYTPNSPNDPNLYYEYEWALSAVAGGGNGTGITATRSSVTNNTCISISLKSTSNAID